MAQTVPVTRNARRALIAIAVGAVAVIAIAARPVDPLLLADSVRAVNVAPRADGVTFVYSMKSANGARDKKKREAIDRVATVRIQDGNARMDFTLGSPTPNEKGAYMLILGDAKQFAIVNEKEKKAMIMDASALGSGTGTAMDNAMLKVSFKDASFAYQDLGAGDKILGYATRHVRITSGNTTEMRILGMKRSSTSADTSEQWIATGIGLEEASMLAWAKSFGSGVKSTNPELAAQMEKYHREYGRTGLAMRTVTYSHITDEKGKVEHDTLTMEVTDLKKGHIDDAMFKIPAGYEVVNMSEMMASAKSSMDSAKAESAKNDKDKGQKKDTTSAKDALKQGLKGIFKKPPGK